MAPTPYTISVPDEKIDKLKKRLELTEYPDELDTPDQWPYGAPVADVKRLAKYWQDTYDWKKHESELNTLPNFTTQIPVDGFGDIIIHFLHQTSPNPAAIPLLFVHGWPGSFLEVTKLLPLLRGSPSQNQPSFHVIAPSLPNFGFSQRITQRGFALEQYAETCHKLMQSLGYTHYATQGGDWGFYITRAIGLLYPDSCKASHINMIRASPPSLAKGHIIPALQHALTPYSDKDKAGLERTQWFAESGSGYRHLQSTKPQTLSYAFADSPLALLAWIYEKLHDWTDGYPWTDEEVLTWVSIYWFSTAGPNAHVRIYYEVTNAKTEKIEHRDRMREWIGGVKLGLSRFPRELSVVPRTWGRTLGPVVYESDNDKGGHFAAWERPDVISNDLINMFKKGGPVYGIVEGKSGYES